MGIRRTFNKLVEYHGKGICDQKSVIAKAVIDDAAVRARKLLDPGTQDLARFCALSAPRPTVPKTKKSSWKAVSRYFWGFMNMRSRPPARCPPHRPSPLAQPRPAPEPSPTDALPLLPCAQTDRYTRFAVPDSKGFKGSDFEQQYIGLCQDREKAEKDGPLQVRKGICNCDACVAERFHECKMQHVVGKVRRVEAKLPPGGQLRVPQLVALE